jgi:hypothetical protein
MNEETVDWINSHFNEYNVLDIDLPIKMKVILLSFKLIEEFSNEMES